MSGSRPWTVTALLASLAAASGCANSSEASAATEPSAGLTLVDSLVLVESPQAFIGKPTHMAVSAELGYYVSDAFSRTVMHISREGAVDQVIGRRGRGPGEFEAPSTVLVTRDSLLLVADQARGGVVVRDLVHDTERALVRIEGNRPTMTLVGDTVYAGTVNVGRGTALARWTTTAGDSVRYFGTLPAAFLRSPMRQFIHNVSLVAWQDTVAYVVGLSETVYIATTDGTVRDSMPVPRAHRRGVPGEGRLAALRDPRAVAAATSLPWALGALSDGRLVVVFADGEVMQGALGGRLFVSVVDRRGGRSCADLPLPGDGHELPRIVFDGDQMLVLEQRVIDGKALSVLRRYRFDASCHPGAT